MEELYKIFKQTFADKIFTRSEKKAVKQLLKEYTPDMQMQDLLRSKIFNLARQRMKDHANEAVLNWLEEANKLIAKSGEEPESEDKVYFSPGTECRNAIIDALESAKQSIYICVFTISDNQISEKIAACHERKINIKLLTDDDKTFDRGSDIAKLANKGINVKVDRTNKHMHHKFAIIDDALLLTGSYNWTRSAAEYNEENILTSTNKQLINAYRQEFDKLWSKMRDY
ncbi:MAG: nuclease [Bacteroidia bacterium]|nr:MAG: nuclease [Bacteroidia bacterium]